MAASVLLIVGDGITQKKLLDEVIEKASSIELGTGSGQCGPVIDIISKKKIMKYLKDAEENCGAVLN